MAYDTIMMELQCLEGFALASTKLIRVPLFKLVFQPLPPSLFMPQLRMGMGGDIFKINDTKWP